MSDDSMAKSSNEPNRRGFLKTTGVTAAGLAATSTVARTAHAQGSDEIRFAVVGFGGRGAGATQNIMETKGNVKLVAIADTFPKNARRKLESIRRRYPDKVDVPEDRIFGELDGYKSAIDADCDVVVIATPPAFKPQQFEYAVQKGKHVFSEKPVASDVAGVKRFMQAVEESKKKNLLVGIGLQRRHEPKYMQAIEQIHDGAIGDVIALRVYWNGGGIWHRSREDLLNVLPEGITPTEMAYQVNNWYHFIWLSGDQICEQHIHNLDVGCWAKGEYPVKCNGMGGRERRMDGDATKSQIFDHTFCEYTFADGTKMWSQGRHLANSWTNVSEFAHGSKGTCDFAPAKIEGANQWQFAGQNPNGHQQEQHDLIESLMRGEIYNEGEYGAKSTFTAILGREACYSAKEIGWDELWEGGKDLCPGIDSYGWSTKPPVVPGPNGEYPVPVPGVYDWKA